MSKSAAILPIIVALVGIIVPVLAFVDSSNPFSAPNIEYEIDTKAENHLITLKNTGSAEATNVTAILKSESMFVPEQPRITFSSIDFQNLVITNTTLKMEIPKFPPGDGSRIQIEFPKNNIPPLTAFSFDLKTYFVYDQGSNSQDIFSFLVAILVFVIVFEMPIIFILTSYVILRRKIMKRVGELLQIRDQLVNSIQNNNLTKIKLEPTMRNYYERTALANHSLIQEYTTILDFEQLLEERNNMQEANYQFKNKNKSCLSKLDSILNQTNWSTHYEMQTIFKKIFISIKSKQDDN